MKLVDNCSVNWKSEKWTLLKTFETMFWLFKNFNCDISSSWFGLFKLNSRQKYLPTISRQKWNCWKLTALIENLKNELCWRHLKLHFGYLKLIWSVSTELKMNWTSSSCHNWNQSNSIPAKCQLKSETRDVQTIRKIFHSFSWNVNYSIQLSDNPWNNTRLKNDLNRIFNRGEICWWGNTGITRRINKDKWG